MVWMTLSTCWTSCLHMLFSSWFAWHSPHAEHHVSICCSPHGTFGWHSLHAGPLPCLHMLLSTWFGWHSPHAGHHVSICCSPHGLHDILHTFDIIAPYVVLHMVWMTFSTCWTSCLHMLFSTWFFYMCPYAYNHISRTVQNLEDTFLRSVRTPGCVHMLADTRFLYLLPMEKYSPP